MKTKVTIPESVQTYLALTLQEDRTGEDLTAEAWQMVCDETQDDDLLDWTGICQEWAGSRTSTDNRIEMKNLYDIIDEHLAEIEER